MIWIVLHLVIFKYTNKKLDASFYSAFAKGILV